ncbi:MAG: hypothetical protein AB1782_12390 [Cyanobacteriota bacterium]
MSFKRSKTNSIVQKKSVINIKTIIDQVDNNSETLTFTLSEGLSESCFTDKLNSTTCSFSKP